MRWRAWGSSGVAVLACSACADEVASGRASGLADPTTTSSGDTDSPTDGESSGSDTDASSTGGGSDTEDDPGPRPTEPLSDVCFEPTPSVPWTGITPRWLTDVTGDGHADAIVVTTEGGQTRARVFVGGRESQRWTTDVPSDLELPGELQIADIDGDARTDVIGVGSELVAFVGNDDASLTALPMTTSLVDFESATLLDFDRDGRVDLLGTTFEGVLESHRGRGDGSFERVAMAGLSDELPSTKLYAGRSGSTSAGVMMGTAAGCLDCGQSAFSVLGVSEDGSVVPLGLLEFSAMWALIVPTVASVHDSARPEVFVDFGIDQRSVFTVGDGELVTAGYLPNGPVDFGDLNADGVIETVLLDGDDLLVYGDGPPDVRPVVTAEVGASPELAIADADADGWADVVLIDPVGFDPETGDLQPTLTVMLSRPCK